MKKIPKNIENKIRSCAKHYAIANAENEELRQWLFKNNLSNSMCDMLIDSCQISNSPESFIDFLNGEPDEYGQTIGDFIDNEIEDIDDYN